MSGRLVLHADDLGMSQAVTDGILHTFRHGVLTSTSVLANAPDATRAIKEWKALAEQHAAGALPSMPARRRLGDTEKPFDFGVHLNLTQGRPLGPYPAELLDGNGCFPGVLRFCLRLWRSGDRFRAAVREELERQVQFVRDHGLRPTHLNGHQYIEMLPPVARLIPAVARLMPEMVERFGIARVRVAWEPSLCRTTLLTGRHTGRWPLACLKRRLARRFLAFADAHAIPHPDLFYGSVHAGRVDLALLRRFLASAEGAQLVEIAVHPGKAASEPPASQSTGVWRDPLAAQRPKELRMLVSDELPALLERTGWLLGRLSGIAG